MSVNIHGKEYITVAERVQQAHNEKAFEKLETKVLSHNPVVIKAIVTIKGFTYTGISAANPNKAIEKQSPYEVAETSSVGRALGFAGYGIIEGIASADEVKKDEQSDPIMEVTKGMGSDKPASEGQRKMIFAVAKELGFDADKTKEIVKTNFNLDSFNDLTIAQAKTAIEGFLKKAKK